MTAFFATLLNIAVVVFAVSSMLAVGLAHPFRRIVGPLRNTGTVMRALVANFVLVPLLAYLVLQLLPLSRPVATGIVLVSMAAGAPFLIRLTEAAESDVGLSATLLIVLLPATVVYMPLMVPRVAPGAVVSAGAIARPLVLTLLLPLAIGMIVRSTAERLATRVRPWLSKLSSISLVVLVISTVVANFRGILGLLRPSPIFAALIVIAGAFVIGYLLGGSDRDAREVLGLGTAQRNIGAATVVATQDFPDRLIVSMVVITSLVGFAVLFPVAAWLRRAERKRAAVPGGDSHA